MSFEEDFLAHYGKKGMKWGVQRAVKKKEKLDEKFKKSEASLTINPKTGMYKRSPAKKNLKAFTKANRQAEKLAVKQNPNNFKRDVAETRKGAGVKPVGGTKNLRFSTKTKLDHIKIQSKTGWVDSRNKDIAEDYALGVLRKATKKNDRVKIAKIGALYLTPALAVYGVKKISSIR